MLKMISMDNRKLILRASSNLSRFTENPGNADMLLRSEEIAKLMGVPLTRFRTFSRPEAVHAYGECLLPRAKLLDSPRGLLWSLRDVCEWVSHAEEFLRKVQH
jgi:hypothetical protein